MEAQSQADLSREAVTALLAGSAAGPPEQHDEQSLSSRAILAAQRSGCSKPFLCGLLMPLKISASPS